MVMTEQEWLVSEDPAPMLEYLWGKVGDRKLRLFRCAWMTPWSQFTLQQDKMLPRLKAEMAAQSSLLRHIIGNPFRPYAAPPSWPSTVVQLAESLYNGQDCAFALHDALLDAGHAELAEHFREEQQHPTGCWVLDLVLGKS
jgi:hypothetical protein